MDIQEYIASGILEAYLAGELTAAEMREVDRVSDNYNEVRIELDSLRESLIKYGDVESKAPDEKILEGALDAITEIEKQKFLNVLNDEPEIKIKRVNIVPAWTIAASILLFISLGFNYLFYAQFKSTKDQLASLESNQTSLANRVSDSNQQLQYAELRIAHLMSEDNIHIKMDGLDLAPEAFANVFWNKKSNSVFISVDNLPDPPHGHQYQLWAIKPGLAPIDAGIFDHSQLVQELKVIKGEVVAFAVTLEVEGGSPIATVDKTFVKGFLKKS